MRHYPTYCKQFVQLSLVALAGTALLLTPVKQASAQSSGPFTVLGSASPWLAGMPSGSVGVPNPDGSASGDTTANASPTQVTGLTIAAGHSYTFSSTGTVSYDGSTPNLSGPEGITSRVIGMGDNLDDGLGDTSRPSWNGMSGMKAPINALVGVFLDNTQPSLTGAPTALDFSSSTARDFSSLTPQLKQVFYIGDGLNNTANTVQTFTAPTGSARLFIGTMDGYLWANNTGSYNVVVTDTPEPSAVALLAFGGTTLLGGTYGSRLRAKRKTSSASLSA